MQPRSGMLLGMRFLGCGPGAKVPLTKPAAEPDPWAPPTDAVPAGGSAAVAGEAADPADSTPPPPGAGAGAGAGARAGAAGAPVPPVAGAANPAGPQPWTNPFAHPAAAPSATRSRRRPRRPPPLPRETPSRLPEALSRAIRTHLRSARIPTPTLTPIPTPGSSVPPPPIAPDGPGQMPYGYGYPGYPGYGGPGGGPGYGWPGMPMAPSNGLGTAGLVLGIIAAVGFCLWPVALACGILAVIFGAIGRGKARRGEATNPGQALAGIICGAVGIALAIAFVVLFLVMPEESGSGDSETTDDGFSTSLTVEG
jgi:hypothetical protein